MVNDIIAECNNSNAKCDLRNVSAVRRLGKPFVVFSTAMDARNKSLQSFLNERMYRHERVEEIMARARRVMHDLFEVYMHDPKRLPQGWRTQLELARIRQGGTVMALDAWVGAATLSRSWGPFTPYLSWSAARSTPDSLRVVRDLESATVPAAVPGAALLNASMRYAADSVLVYDQHSLALGSSWALGPTTKLKLEWMQTRARLSTLIDVPAGEPLERPRQVNVLSLSYSFVY